MTGFNGILHKDGNGVLWLDDRPIHGPEDVPRHKNWAGTVWYSGSNVEPKDIFRIMGPDDEVFGPSPGKIVGISFRCGNGKSKFRVFSSTIWGVESSSQDDLYQKLQAVMLEAAQSGFEPKTSAAATSMSAYMNRYDGRDGRVSTRQLPSRWRAIAHAAFHGGPVIVTKGSAPWAAHIDMRSAYLDALSKPVPVLGVINEKKVGGWFTSDERRWSKIRAYFGFVDATVKILPEHAARWGIPPLPVKLFQGSVFAQGIIRGCWPIHMVVSAEERGEVIVEKVHQWAFAPQTEPLFAAIARDFSLASRKTGKLMYTRFWAKWASKGGFIGRKTNEPSDGAVKSFGLWWEFDGVNIPTTEAPRTYRPDISAIVASYNHTAVMETIRKLEPGSVIATHVDAIWTSDIAGAINLSLGTEQGSWVLKRQGPLRFYGPGCYNHDGKLGASGYDSNVMGPLTPERLERWAGGNQTPERNLTLQARVWSADPARYPEATSTPITMDMINVPPPTEGPLVNDSCWTPSGWMREPQAVFE